MIKIAPKYTIKKSKIPKRGKKTVAVGMSGGVDSTVAAFLLKQKGYDVIGITMKIWDGLPHSRLKKNGCYGPGEKNDIKDAARAAKMIKIKHYVIDLTKEYKKDVLKYFRSEYEKGRTPNPCVVCNAKIKFNQLLIKALKSGIKFDYFATGHYARLRREILNHKSQIPNKFQSAPPVGGWRTKSKIIYQLLKAKDKIKDQSYFLYRLKQNQLKKIIFPLGDKTKQEVRQIARKNGFIYYDRKRESQDFIEADNYFSLLPTGQNGQIIDYQGNVLGKHQGISHYTIGQRKNLNISGLKESYYVLKINAKKNIIIVGPKEFSYSKTAKIKNINWIINPKIIKKKTIEAKIRYGTKPAKCKIFIKGKMVILNFIKPQFAVTPGQSAVFYSGDKLLGGGTIVG
jgi:tRNA-specific 2-thiouridylase